MRRKKNQDEPEKIEENIELIDDIQDDYVEEIKTEEKKEDEGIKEIKHSDFQESQSEFSWINLSKKFFFALVFLLPIFFLPITLYPISFNQQSLALILAALILGSLSLSAITKGEIIFSKVFKEKSLIKLSIWFLLLVFIVSLVNSLILSRSINYSLWGLNGSEMNVFIGWIVGIILLLTGSVILNSKNDFKKLINFIIFSSIIAFAIFIIVNTLTVILKRPLFGFFFNGFNTIGTIGIFSSFIGLGFFAILMFLKFGAIEKIKTKKFLTTCLILMFGVLLMISHRPTFIALIFSLALFMILYIYRNNEIQISKLNTATFFVFVFLILNFVRLPIPSLFNLPMEVSLSHITSLKVAWSSLTESAKNFFFGSGLNTYTFEYLKYKPADINSSLFWNFDFSSGASFWATILPTIGIIGTIFLFLFFLSIFTISLKTFISHSSHSSQDENENDKNIFIILISIFFYMFVLSLFLPFNFILLIMLFIITAALIGKMSLVKNNFIRFKFSEATIKNIFISFVFVSILVGSFIFFVLSVKRYAAHAIFGNAIYAYNTGRDIDKTISKIGTAAKLHLNEDFARNLSALWFEKLKTLIDSAPSSNIDTLKPRMQETFNNSTGAMQVAIGLNPLNYQYWNEMGNIYERVIIIAPDSDKLAIQSFHMAQKLNPKTPSMFLNLARIEVIRGDNGLKNKSESYNSAEKYLQKAIALKNNYNDAYLMLSQIYEKSGRADDAIKNLEDRVNVDSGNIGLLFQLGFLKYQYGDYNGAKDVFIRIVFLSPNYSDAKYYLGLIYDKLGETDKAIQEFEEILKLNPDNQDIIRILNNLKSGRNAL